MEPPHRVTKHLDSLNGFFNWTMTYRLDSDFPHPYGRVRQLKEHPPAGSKELDALVKEFGIANAKRLNSPARSEFRAAWFASNCKSFSKREQYGEEMRQANLSVDVYGKCGSLVCLLTNRTTCYKEMERDYKFYLSFENAVCKDYVTEKLFNILSGYNVIPVVLGGADYAAIAPPHSYIRALDFATPRQLVDKLK